MIKDYDNLVKDINDYKMVFYEYYYLDRENKKIFIGGKWNGKDDTYEKLSDDV